MRNIFYQTLIVISITLCQSCYSQELQNLDVYEIDINENDYVQDINNELEKFEGTWQSSSNTNILNLKVIKIQNSFNGEYFEDYIIGEYQYLENGITIVNTLQNLEDPNITPNNNTIGGRLIITPNEYPTCSNCSTNERRLKLYFVDPERDYLSLSITLRYLNGNIPEQITATIISEHGVVTPNEDSPTLPRVPYGTYTLTKTE